MEANHYKLLGLEPTASKHEIKSAYRALARKLHPDVAKDTESATRFKLISNAYTTLYNDERRQDYDRELAEQQFRQARVYTNADTRPQDNSFEARMLRRHAAWANRTSRGTRWVAYTVAFVVPAALLWCAGEGSFHLLNHKTSFDGVAPVVKRYSAQDVERMLAQQSGASGTK